MGCCNSKSDDDREDDIVASQFTPRTGITNHQVPPIIITKAQSVASVDSLHASSSANAITKPVEDLTESEKPPVIIEERTQEHQYGEPPAFEEQATANTKAIIKDTKPIIIVTPQSEADPTIIPAPAQLNEDSTLSAEPKQINTSLETATKVEENPSTASWTILIRLSTSDMKDILVDIPTSAPFMTVLELKNKINIPSDQQIKLIHLGRILKDNFILVPSSITSVKSDVIKVSNRGVIQAMVYRN